MIADVPLLSLEFNLEAESTAATRGITWFPRGKAVARAQGQRLVCIAPGIRDLNILSIHSDF